MMKMVEVIFIMGDHNKTAKIPKILPADNDIPDGCAKDVLVELHHSKQNE